MVLLPLLLAGLPEPSSMSILHKQKDKLTAALLMLSLAIPSTAFAQGIKSALPNLYKSGERLGGAESDLPTLVGSIINAALSMVGLIFLVLMVYAGFLWMTASGEESQVEKAQDIIKGSIIGIVVVVSAYAITAFVTSRLGGV